MTINSGNVSTAFVPSKHLSDWNATNWLWIKYYFDMVCKLCNFWSKYSNSFSITDTNLYALVVILSTQEVTHKVTHRENRLFLLSFKDEAVGIGHTILATKNSITNKKQNWSSSKTISKYGW